MDDLEPVSPPKIGGSLPHDEYIRALYSIAKSLKRTADETPTLRDWFAGQALAGYLAEPSIGADKTVTAQRVYEYADAMLAARSTQGDQ